MPTPAADNRAHILACALQLFAARGYDAIGVQEICQAAGVTKPTLYHYFGSKRGLLETLTRERFAPLLASVRAATTFHGDVAQTLRRVTQAYFTFAAAEPALYRLQLTLWFAPPDSEAFQVSAGIAGEQQALLEELFAAVAAQNGNLRGRERLHAATLLGTINTAIGLALNGHAALDEPGAHRLVQHFVYGIYS